MLIYGIQPVLEGLRAGRVTRIQVTDLDRTRHAALLRLAQERGVAIERVDREWLDRATRHGVHQGVAAHVEAPRDYGIPDLIPRAEAALIVVLDGVEDPHNFGAILRTVDAAGAHGVVQQTRRAAALGGAAAKAAAGAASLVKVARVVNIARALDELKEAGVWTVALAAEGDRAYDTIDLTLPTAVVVGAEGAGLRRLVRERCDWHCAIPMRGHVSSLNVSVATGIVLFEAVRQRRTARHVRNPGSARSSPPR
jgi:23S rRNA (guanosine2251-2'-O)-methyltransferase